MSELDKVFSKVKDLVLSFKKEKIGRLNNYDEKKSFFEFCEDEHAITIGSKYTFYGKNSQSISEEDMFKKIENYLKNGGKKINFPLDGRIRQRSCVTFLMKEKPEEDLRNRILECFLISKSTMEMTDSFDLLSLSCKNEPKNQIYAKKCSNYLIEGVYNNSKKDGSYLFESSFLQIVRCLKVFKYEKEDYPYVHKLFQSCEEQIKKNGTAKDVYVDFLKKCIPPSDWEEFKKYSNTNKEEVVNEPLFSEVSNPTYHLKINEEVILKKHPVLSLSNDYKIMVNELIKGLNKNKDDIGIDIAYILPSSEGKTQVYFISKDERNVDEKMIKSIFSFMIDSYAETLEIKKEINSDFLDTAFKASILASKLDLKENVSYKKMKI